MRFLPRVKISTVMFVTALLACIAASVVHLGPLSLLIGLSATFIGTLTGILAGSRRIPKAWTRITAVVFCRLATLFVSYGPATWILATFYTADSRPEIVASTHRKIYLPVSHCVLSSPRPMRDVMVSYLAWWMPSDVTFHDWGNGIGWSSQSKQLPGKAMTYTLLHY